VFINDLPKILNFQCVPFLALPKVYQELFNGWVEDVKQQSWDGMEQKGWYNYREEFLLWLIPYLVATDFAALKEAK
jgi:hypothetical protein